MDSFFSKKISSEVKMKIRFASLIFVVIASIGGMLVLGKFGMDTLSSLRAFVSGESVYSTKQQAAAISLFHYVHTKDPKHYDEFLENIRVPLGNRKARLELEKPNPDMKKVFEAFEEGGNQPEDIDGMIALFNNFKNFEFLKHAVRIWEQADEDVVEVVRLGEELHRLVQSDDTTSSQIEDIRNRLLDLNREFHGIEKEYSSTLADASRWAKGLFIKIMSAFAIITAVVCFLAISLVGRLITKMQKSAKDLELQHWLKSGQTALNEKMRAEQDILGFSSSVLNFICEHLGISVGAMFVSDQDDALRMVAGYAFEKRKGLSNRFELGEGLVGQSALEKKHILMTDCPDGYMCIRSGLGAKTPCNILAYPLVHKGTVQGVVELGAFREFTDLDIEYLRFASDAVAIAISGIISRRKEAELLEKTQQQAEELTAQQEELRATNEELEEYARTLKESEQKLQVQQEELRAANEELTEQAQTLEEKSEEIEKKNKELEVSRREAEEKARELECTGKYKSEFLANMSHELRTPLNSILLLSKLLNENKNGNLTAKQAEFAQTIHSSGSDLLNLINEILDLSKVEAGKMEFNISQFSLERLAVKVQRIYEKIAEEKGLRFAIDIHPDIPRTMHTDFQRLEQIVKNFVSNAIKFTEKGRVTLTIGRPSKDKTLCRSGLTPDKTIAFCVSDTGIGIEKQMQQFIFEAFRQADGSTNRKFGGTGLGLSISRELAKHLGGEIQVESDAGKGSTFTLYLPERFAPPESESEKVFIIMDDKEDAKDDDEDVKKVEAPAAGGVAKSPGTQLDVIRDDRRDLSPNEKSILIIEDDPGLWNHKTVGFCKISMLSDYFCHT